MIKSLEKELILLSNKAKYIKENLDGTIDLRKKKGTQVTEMLQSKGYDLVDLDYNYLTKMPMDSVTEENVDRLYKQHGEKITVLETVKSTTIHQMWLNELETLNELYIKYKEGRSRTMTGSEPIKKKEIKSVYLHLLKFIIVKHNVICHIVLKSFFLIMESQEIQ